VYRFDAAAGPANGARQLDIGAQAIGRGRKTLGLLDVRDYRLDVAQRAREPGGETVGQQREGAMGLGTIPARDACTGWVDALITSVACKRAPAARMDRAARQGCIPPGLSANVLLAGEVRFESKLHRPTARTGAAVAGLFFFLLRSVLCASFDLGRENR